MHKSSRSRALDWFRSIKLVSHNGDVFVQQSCCVLVYGKECLVLYPMGSKKILKSNKFPTHIRV